MIKRRKKEDDSIGPSRGWAKLLHRTVMFLLFPLRKPLWCLGIILVLYLAPTFRGVKPAEVHLWYWSKITGLTNKTAEQIADKATQVLPAVGENIGKVVETVSTKVDEFKPTQEIIGVVNQPLRQTSRQTFSKADTSGGAIKTIKVEKNVTTAASATASLPKPTTTRLKNLRYLDIAEMISGAAVAVNANELIVKNKSVFLYGIYVSPSSPKGQEAESALQRLISGNQLSCKIIAYTLQNVPTAICYVNGMDINRWMVEQGYSKNVALD